MAMYDKILGFFAKGTTPSGAGGASPLPPQAPVNVKVNKQASFPAYVTSTAVNAAVLPQTDLNVANLDLNATYRYGQTTKETIRNLVRVNPDLAGAVSAHLRIGIPEKYIALARNQDGSFNEDATRLAMSLLRRWDTSPDYLTGFSQTDSLRSCSEALGKEGVSYGGMMLELVLDKQRLPSFLQPLSVTQLKWYEDGKGLRPVQDIGGTEIDLDYPTIFYVAIDASLLDPYAQSPLESAIQPVLASTQFLNDLRRVSARHVYPRYDITIDELKFRATLSPEVAADEKLIAGKINEVFDSVASMINNLGVEEALVHFDFIKVSYVQGQDGDVPQIFSTIKDIHDAKLATGAKTLPAILGHGTGSQNIASTESMLAMMTANSIVRIKLMELYSRALTMSCRLFGQDVTVNFEFDTIDLRPDSELEAFRTMKSDRLMRQLSYGLITDAECCLRLTGQLPPPGYVVLSGTRFMDGTAPPDMGNPYSGTSSGGGQSGGGANTQSRKSKTPEQSKS